MILSNMKSRTTMFINSDVFRDTEGLVDSNFKTRDIQ